MNHNPITFYKRGNDEKLEYTLRYTPAINNILLHTITYQPVSNVPFTGFLEITVIGALQVTPIKYNLTTLEIMPKLPGNLFFRNNPDVIPLPSGNKTVTITLDVTDKTADFELTLNHTLD